MTTLQQHSKDKEKRVSGLDWMSIGLGLSATGLALFSIMQPKNPANMIRLPLAFALSLASVGAERLRESDLESLQSAVGYQSSIKSDRIRFKTVLEEETERLKEAEQAFFSIPEDRWPQLAAKIGIAPPAIEARQAMQQASQPQPATVATMPDPTGDFDPEAQQQPPIAKQNNCYWVRPHDAEIWFEGMAGRLPQGLVDEWRSNPGSAIEVDGSSVKIIRGES